MLPSSGLTMTISSIGMPRLEEVLVQHRRRVQVVDRHVEKALNLGGVQVHRQHAIGAGPRDQVGHQLGRDRHAAFVLAVLPGVAEVRNHGRDPLGAGPLATVDHDQAVPSGCRSPAGRSAACRNTSRPRMSSSILQEISPSGNCRARCRPAARPGTRRSAWLSWRIGLAAEDFQVVHGLSCSQRISFGQCETPLVHASSRFDADRLYAGLRTADELLHFRFDHAQALPGC